jgi:hypothetical protein
MYSPKVSNSGCRPYMPCIQLVSCVRLTIWLRIHNVPILVFEASSRFICDNYCETPLLNTRISQLYCSDKRWYQNKFLFLASPVNSLQLRFTGFPAVDFLSFSLGYGWEEEFGLNFVPPGNYSLRPDFYYEVLFPSRFTFLSHRYR